jgi:hypothetical protein
VVSAVVGTNQSGRTRRSSEDQSLEAHKPSWREGACDRCRCALSRVILFGVAGLRLALRAHSAAGPRWDLGRKYDSPRGQR